ncbi:MAG: hypothetical protein ACR2QC_03220 [Gammaproteobacteria bacterium]
MKNINFLFCAAKLAVFGALNNVLTPVKGGGGQQYKNAPFGGVFRRFFPAFALSILFAAAFGTTAANAQEARARVYSVPTTTFEIGGRTVNLGETLAEIVDDFTGGIFPNNGLGLAFRKLNLDGSETAANINVDGDGLPIFGTPVAAGERIRINDLFAPGGAVPLITLRVYRNAAGVFALADGDTPVGRITTASDLDLTREFFLTDDWRYTLIAVAGTQGYVDPRPCDDATPVLSTDGSICQTEAAAAAETASDSAPAPGGDSNARDLAVVGLGLGVVGFMAAYLSGGDFSLFHFAPDYGYSATESGYAYNVGGRLNFRKDNWHLYYAAGQENSNGEFSDFRYESGGEYTADLWTAAFSETVQGETADYDFSLSADYHGGIWRLSPTYRLHSRLDEDETETRNSLNLESVLRYNRWTISPSAGFRWESADEFGDNARFNLSAVRRF